jgi:cytochrome c-type biogenesis protein CcsB
MPELDLILYWAGLVAYCLATGVYSFAMVFQRERPWSVGHVLLALGFAAQTVSLGLRWYVTGHMPTIGNYENTNMAAWFIVAFTVWFIWRYPMFRPAGVFTLPIAVLTMGFGLTAETATSPMVGSLKSWWLYIHIFFAWLVTGAMSFATGASVMYLLKQRKLATDTVDGFWGNLPPQARIEELIYRNAVYGFVAYAVMIGSGAMWAKNLWGAYWSWDPVETWSLISWMIYGLILHLRFTFGWRGTRMAWMVILALISVFVAMFGVNFAVDSSMHIFNVR